MRSPRRWAISRPVKSEPPPGANGTTKRTGFAGYCWPVAGSAASATINAVQILSSIGMSPPAGALAHGSVRRVGLRENLLHVDGGEPAALLEDAAVDYDRLDVRRLRHLDYQMRRIGEHADVRMTRVHHDQVGALAFDERADALVEAERFRAEDRAHLERAPRGELELVVGDRIVDVLHRFHDREHVRIARERRGVDRKADWHTGIQILARVRQTEADAQ